MTSFRFPFQDFILGVQMKCFPLSSKVRVKFYRGRFTLFNILNSFALDLLCFEDFFAALAQSEVMRFVLHYTRYDDTLSLFMLLISVS